MTEHIESAYLAVKTDTAQKLSRNGGGITYKVLTDPDRQHLFLTIVGDDGVATTHAKSSPSTR